MNNQNNLNKEIEQASLDSALEKLRKILENTTVSEYQPGADRAERYKKIPIAFDPELEIEKIALERAWQGINDAKEQIPLVHGPHQGYFNDHWHEKTRACAMIELSFSIDKSPRKDNDRTRDYLNLIYFAANLEQEDPELIIQDRYGNVYYWRSEGIDTLPR